MQPQRIEFEPAYVLHARPFGDSSLLLEVFTPQHGRTGLIAKGARAPKSRKRALLQVLQPLLLSWQQRGELCTLTVVEPASQAIALAGETLFCAWYANELLMKLLPRQHPHPLLFAAYNRLLARLPTEAEPALRAFECTLLDELGVSLGLSDELDAATCYRYVAGQGLVRAEAGEAGSCSGAALMALRDDTLNDDANLLQQTRVLLRSVLRGLLGGRALESAQLLRELRSLS